MGLSTFSRWPELNLDSFLVRCFFCLFALCVSCFCFFFAVRCHALRISARRVHFFLVCWRMSEIMNWLPCVWHESAFTFLLFQRNDKIKQKENTKTIAQDKSKREQNDTSHISLFLSLYLIDSSGYCEYFMRIEIDAKQVIRLMTWTTPLNREFKIYTFDASSMLLRCLTFGMISFFVDFRKTMSLSFETCPLHFTCKTFSLPN